MANGNGGTHTAPYGPWSAFETWLAGFKGKPAPTRLEPGLFTGMSGSGQSQLRGALRFFGVVSGERDEVIEERFHELVEAVQTERWQALLRELIPSSYAHITEGVDLDKGTEGDLRDAFKSRGLVDGSSNKKARRFFLSAMQAAGIGVSPFFGQAGPRASNGKSRPRRSRPRQQAQENVTDQGGGVPEDMKEIGCSLPNGRRVRVMVPKDLTAGEERFLVKYISEFFELERSMNE